MLADKLQERGDVIEREERDDPRHQQHQPSLGEPGHAADEHDVQACHHTTIARSMQEVGPQPHPAEEAVEARRDERPVKLAPERLLTHPGPKAQAQEQAQVRIGERRQTRAMMQMDVLPAIPGKMLNQEEG